MGASHVGGEDLAAWTVSWGWALAYWKYSDRYSEDGNQATPDKVSLWSGTFVSPWEWRERDKKCGPYKNCTELRKDHPKGIIRDHCAYQRKMDLDNDGHACE